MLLSKVQAEHRSNFEKQEKEFSEAQNRAYLNEERLILENDDLLRENHILKEKISGDENRNVRLSD